MSAIQPQYPPTRRWHPTWRDVNDESQQTDSLMTALELRIADLERALTGRRFGRRLRRRIRYGQTAPADRVPTGPVQLGATPAGAGGQLSRGGSGTPSRGPLADHSGPRRDQPRAIRGGRPSAVASRASNYSTEGDPAGLTRPAGVRERPATSWGEGWPGAPLSAATDRASDLLQ